MPPRSLRSLLVALTVAAVACGGSADPPSAGGSTATSESTSSTSAGPTTTALLAADGECGLTGTYPAPWPERPRYRARLDVDPVAGTVDGALETSFTPPDDTDRLVFRLWANMPRVGSGGGRLEVRSTRLDGEPVATRYEPGGGGPGTPGTILVIDGAFPAGRTVEVELDFDLDLPGAINERVAKVGDSVRLGSVLPMLGWIRGRGWHTSPAVGNFSEAVASEVADYDVTVTVPEGFGILATGEEVEPGRFVGEAVRDWAATVARFRLAEGTDASGRVRVVVGASEGAGDDPQRRLADVIAALDEFGERYGPYPYPVLTMGITPSLSGGIEFPQHIHLGAETSRDHLVHEVAHMWFYGLVGNDQYRDPWLDEGLAEYAETLFLGNTASQRTRSIPAAGRGRLGAGHDYWATNTAIFFRSVYIQGMQAVAAVGDAVGGPDAMDCALRRYVLDHAFGVAEPADFVAAVTEQTGVDPSDVLAGFGVTPGP